MASGDVSPIPSNGTSTPTISLRDIPTTICVFCGSCPGKSEVHMAAARSLAEVFHKHNIHLVFGGGTMGIMGELARTLVKLSGPESVHGIIPAPLIEYEQGRSLTKSGICGIDARIEEESIYGRTTVVRDMHTRKNMMAKEVLAGGPGSGFIALSGGYGTLEELMEVVTWHQLGIHDRGVVVLNIDGYWDGLLKWVKTSFEEGFIQQSNDSIIVEAKGGEEAVMALQKYKPSVGRFNLEWGNE